MFRVGHRWPGEPSLCLSSASLSLSLSSLVNAQPQAWFLSKFCHHDSSKGRNQMRSPHFDSCRTGVSPRSARSLALAPLRGRPDAWRCSQALRQATGRATSKTFPWCDKRDWSGMSSELFPGDINWSHGHGMSNLGTENKKNRCLMNFSRRMKSVNHMGQASHGKTLGRAWNSDQPPDGFQTIS